MENYLEYLNESPTVFFKCKNDEGWSVEFVTDNVERIFGFKKEDFLSKKLSFIDMVYKEDKEQILSEVTSLYKSEQQKIEFSPYRILTPANHFLWVQDITKIVEEENGEFFYYCYITDITKQIKTNEKLAVSENIISTMYNNSVQFIGLLDAQGILLRANKTSLEFASIKEEDVVGKYFWDCPWWQHSVEAQDDLKEDIKKAASGEFIQCQKIHLDSNGNKIYVDFTIKPVYNSQNEVIYLIPEGKNITDEVLQQKQLSSYIKIINENILISTTDLDGKITSCSDKFSRTSGFAKEELFSNKHNIMKHEDNDDSTYEDLWKTITQGNIWVGEHKNISKDGKIFWVENIITPNLDENNKIESYTSVYNEITLRKEISELLITDVLTNVYNRRHFTNIFKSELKRSRRHNFNFALLMIDIDYFKQYNDTYGHQSGDIALVSVANALKNTLKRADDYIFRIGGEEFCVLTTDITRDGVIKLAHELKSNVEALHLEHKKSDVSNYITVSVGINLVEEDSFFDEDEIYNKADEALYKAKEEGRNKVHMD